MYGSEDHQFLCGLGFKIWGLWPGLSKGRNRYTGYRWAMKAGATRQELPSGSKQL